MSLETQLIKSCTEGDLDKVNQLIEFGVDIHTGNPYQFERAHSSECALRTAACNKHIEIVHRLIECGANINIAIFYSEVSHVKEYLSKV
jgi:ankyrin repeat protein